MLTFTDNELSAVVSSADNTLILYSKLQTHIDDIKCTLNVPDLLKLSKVIDCIVEEDLILKLNSNNLEYSSKDTKFKYHLFEENFLIPPPIKVDKIKAFATDFSFDLSKEEFNKIIKAATFTTDTNKIYFKKEGDDLVVELGDKTRQNTDSYTLKVGSNFSGELTKQLPINFDNFAILNNAGDKIRVSINNSFSVLLFDVEIGNLFCRYIISSLTQ